MVTGRQRLLLLLLLLLLLTSRLSMAAKQSKLKSGNGSFDLFLRPLCHESLLLRLQSLLVGLEGFEEALSIYLLGLVVVKYLSDILHIVESNH